MSGPAKFLSDLPRPALVLLIAIIFGGSVAAVTFYGSWMLGAILVGGVAALGILLLGLHLISSFIAGRRAQGFGDDLRKDIGRKFGTGLDTFKANDKSIYSLPWYVMVGEPGAGKTEAIRHSNIGFPSGLNKPAQGRGGTVNMDWWFAKKAVLLDTAGRLMFEATEEWRSFLKMLKQHRPLTPINGMILAIPAPSLLTDSTDQIAEKAGQISQQFDAVQRALGVRFPVYVLITKADMIAGFREYFFNLADPAAQNQMLGWSNPDELDQPFQPERVDEHLKSVSRQLQRRKLALLLDPVTVQENSTRRLEQVDAMYAFPTELTRLSSRLRMYLDTIFMPSEWSLKPLFLRGIYFTSAMSEGAALDLDLAEAFGISPAELPVELRIFGREKAYFLKDFFLDKCFPEGGLVTTAKKVSAEISRRRLIVFTAAALAACALIAATLYGQIALRQTVSKPAAFWKTLADARDKSPEPGGPASAFAIVDPTTGQYRGDTPLPPELGGNPMKLFESAQRQDAIAVPLIFKPWDSAMAGLDPLRRVANRNLFEYGILRPVVAAAQLKLTDPKSPLDATAVPAADQILALVSSGSDSIAPAGTMIAVDPLLKFLLPGQFESLPAVFKQLPHPSTIRLYNAAKLPWPPVDLLNVNVDTARILLQKLQDRAADVASEADTFNNLIAKLSAAHDREIALLKVRWSTADSSALTSWAQKLQSLLQAEKESDSALMASGLAGSYQDPDAQAGILAKRFEQISNDRQTTEETFTAFAGQTSLPQIQDARRISESLMSQAITGLNQTINAISPEESEGEKPLSWLEESYLLRDGLRLRIGAYADETSLLNSKSVEGEPPSWKNFADAREKLTLIAPAVDVHSLLDKQANDELKLATAYALGHQRALIEQAVARQLPTDADKWAAEVTDNASRGGLNQQIDPLPLTAQESIAVEPRFNPQAATAVMKSWVKFLADWSTAAGAGSAEQTKIQASGDALRQYVQQYSDYWNRDLQSEVKILPFTSWDSARDEILSDNFPRIIQQAMQHASATRADSIAMLAAGCGDTGGCKEILAPHEHEPSAAGNRIAQTWQKIAQGSDVIAEARTLLSSDAAKLFPAGNKDDGPDARYWQALSVAFLRAFEDPAKTAADATLDKVTQQLDHFPVSYPGDGAVLKVAQVKALRDDVANLMAGHSTEGPRNSSVDKEAAQCLGRIAMGSHTGIHRSAELKAKTLEILARSYSANLYLVPDKQMASLPGGAGPVFSTATYISNVPGEDAAPQGWPDGDAVLAGHCDFPNDQLKPTIQLDGNQNVCNLEGGAWWPLVALKIGTPQAVDGETNSWFVHLPVTTNGQPGGAKWFKLEIRGSKDLIENPWP